MASETKVQERREASLLELPRPQAGRALSPISGASFVSAQEQTPQERTPREQAPQGPAPQARQGERRIVELPPREDQTDDRKDDDQHPDRGHQVDETRKGFLRRRP